MLNGINTTAEIGEQEVKPPLAADAGAPNETVKPAAFRARNLTELSQGDIFKATVTDIKQNQVSIRLLGGAELTAKSLVLPDARIGDDTLFLVKENNRGQIFLEMIRPEGDALKENIAREALANAGLYPNGENIKMVKQLMDGNLPIDANSLQRAAFFHYSSIGLSMEKIIFLMKENFPMNEVNIELLDKFSPNGGITPPLDRLADTFSSLDDNFQAQALSKFIPLFELTSPEFADEVKAAVSSAQKGEKSGLSACAGKLKQYLAIRLNGENTLNAVTDYFKLLYKAVSETEKLLRWDKRASGPLRELSDLRNRIEFMNHIGNYKYYMQIPLNINGQFKGAELYVFKEPKNKKDFGKRASVLISLDNESLGHVETFIEKTDKDLSFQFRAEMPESLKIIQSCVNGLINSVTSGGYRITGIAFKHIDGRHRIHADAQRAEGKQTGKRRYSFDMRV